MCFSYEQIECLVIHSSCRDGWVGRRKKREGWNMFVHNLRFACACCFAGNIPRGLTSWKVRARIKLAIDKRSRNFSCCCCGCDLWLSSVYFWHGSSIRFCFVFDIKVIPIIIWYFHAGLFSPGWWWLITYPMTSWVFPIYSIGLLFEEFWRSTTR